MDERLTFAAIKEYLLSKPNIVDDHDNPTDRCEPDTPQYALNMYAPHRQKAPVCSIIIEEISANVDFIPAGAHLYFGSELLNQIYDRNQLREYPGTHALLPHGSFADDVFTMIPAREAI